MVTMTVPSTGLAGGRQRPELQARCGAVEAGRRGIGSQGEKSLGSRFSRSPRGVQVAGVVLAAWGLLLFSGPVMAGVLDCERDWPIQDVTSTDRSVASTAMEIDLSTNAYVASVANGRILVRVISADREIDLEFTESEGEQRDPDFATNSLGLTFMTFAQATPTGGFEVLLADNIGGFFTDPENISEHGADDVGPRVGLDGSGEPHVVWERRSEGATELVYWNRGLTEPDVVGAGEAPSLFLDSSDVVHVVYRRDNDLFHNHNGNLARSFNNERPVVNSPETREQSVSLGGDRDGNLVVTYESDGSLFLALARPETNFLTPQRLDFGGVQDPEMRVRNGTQVAIVYSKNGNIFQVGGTAMDLQLPAEPITATPGVESHPSLDIDLAGNVHVSFIRSGETFYTNNACTPQAEFSVSLVDGEAPLEVRFNDESQGEVKVWSWDFGDGETSNVPSPLHTFLDPGVYSVTLEVTGVGGRMSSVTRERVVDVSRAKNFMGIPDQRVLPGQIGVWFPIIGSHVDPIQGFQAMGKYDPEFLTFTGFSLDNTATRVLEPEFLVVQPFGSHFEVGCIFEFVAPFDGKVLFPGRERRLMHLIFDVPSSAPQGEQTKIRLENDDQISRVTNIFTVDRLTLAPKLRGSTVTIESIRFPLPRLFVRGDVDNNRIVDITDGITLLNFLFLGGEEPVCPDSGDILDVGTLDLTSAITLLNYLFLGGATPAVPFPNLGLDPTDDVLDDC